MQRRYMLGIVAVIVAVVVFCMLLFVKMNGRNTAEDGSRPSSSDLTESVENSTDSAELEELYRDGTFVFTPALVRERFEDTLPEGYHFVEKPVANPEQNDKLQLDILDETGTLTELSLLFNTTEEDRNFNQIALLIKEGGFKEDSAAILEWYLQTFADSLGEADRKMVCEEYLEKMDQKEKEYSLFETDTQSLMMNYMSEGTDGYYYVMIMVQ